MATSEMMNVVVLSCGRNKRWKRHSIAMFNQIQNFSDEEDGDECNPLRSLMSQSLYNKNSTERRLPENNRDLYVIRRLAKSSDGIRSSDLEMLRKAFMERFAACKEHCERIYELKSAICTINEIKTYSCDPQWLTQYQYILNWCYCQIRFISDPAERRRLFFEVKEKYRKMFEMLRNVSDIDKLSSYLRWSQLCYQYAELADQESLSWCMETVASARCALSASSSSSALPGTTDSSGLSGDVGNCGGVRAPEQVEVTKAENRRRRKLITIELIQSNVLKIENVQANFCTERLKIIL